MVSRGDHPRTASGPCLLSFSLSLTLQNLPPMPSARRGDMDGMKQICCLQGARGSPLGDRMVARLKGDDSFSTQGPLEFMTVRCF